MYEYVIPDTNGIIGMMEYPSVETRICKHFSSKFKILLPDCVVKEIKKIKGLSRDDVLAFLRRFGKVTVVRPTLECQIEATNLEEKYSQSHYPDSLLLATAKIGSYTLITYDRGLLQCAKSEGVESFCPKGGFQN